MNRDVLLLWIIIIIKSYNNKMSLPLIQINGKCEVPFYFVCICQKCYIISVKKRKKNNEKKITELIYVKIIKKKKKFNLC